MLTVNSITFGGLLFLLSAGFSLIFGLMRIPNLTHGSLFMLGAYFGATFVGGYLGLHFNFWLAALLAALLVAAFGAVVERLLLRQLPGQQLAQVLVTLGISFMAADFCLMVWGGDPINVATPAALAASCASGRWCFRFTGWPIIVIAVVVAIALWLLLDRTRLGAMIRAGVDDPDMARVVGIRVSQLFTIVFALGAGLAAFAGIIGGPMLSVYPGLDQDMLPLALVVVILGGTGSLLGSFVGSIIIGFIYNFGQAMLPGARLFRAVPADAAGAAAAAARACSAGTCHERRALIALAHRVAVLLVDVPYWVTGIYYVNVASQILFYAIFALGLNVLVGYGGLVSLGHAGLFGIAAYAAGYMLAGRLRSPARNHRWRWSIGIASMAHVCRAVAALDRHRLHHDHAGARPNPLGPGVSLDQRDRRRQRHQLARPARAVRLSNSTTANAFYYTTLVVFADRDGCWLRSSCARRSAPR